MSNMNNPTPEYLGGFLTAIADKFEVGGKQLFDAEKAARDNLVDENNNSDPAKLAKYQALVSEVTLLRNAQSSTVKLFKDVDATIVANFR